MTNYDKVFESNPNKESLYSPQDYPGNKLMVGCISLSNAMSRLQKGEFYTDVTYIDGEQLPKEYISLNDRLDNGCLVATVSPEIRLDYICDDVGSIQRISKMQGLECFRGDESEPFNLKELVENNINELKRKEMSEDAKCESSFQLKKS